MYQHWLSINIWKRLMHKWSQFPYKHPSRKVYNVIKYYNNANIRIRLDINILCLSVNTDVMFYKDRPIIDHIPHITVTLVYDFFGYKSIQIMNFMIYFAWILICELKRWRQKNWFKYDNKIKECIDIFIKYINEDL